MLREMIPESDMDCMAEMETQCFSDCRRGGTAPDRRASAFKGSRVR